jgi:hypothetical protein
MFLKILFFRLLDGSREVTRAGPKILNTESIDKDHWLKLFIRKLTWPTVANILATLPPISPFLDYLSCPLVCVLLSTYCVRPTVPRKNNTMNHFHVSIIGGVVVIESSSRSRVTWFKSSSRQLFVFYLFASFTSYQLPNLTTI